jgi:hypothetical protein
MAYVSSDAPLPQNSRMQPPAECVDASNAAIRLAACISRTGRRLVFNTVPTLASFRPLGLPVVVSAAVALPQSDLARSSILASAVPSSDASTLSVEGGGQAAAPAVVPLNWLAETEGVGSSCGVVQGSAGSAALQQPAVVMPELWGRHRSADKMPVTALERASGARGAGGGHGLPRWSDAAVQSAPTAGVLGWIERNPWLAVGLVGLGVVAFTGGRRA